MGICSSKVNGKREPEWPTENECEGKTNLKKSSSGDFAAFISKLSGGGAAVAAAAAAAAAAEERALQQTPGRLFFNGSNGIACLYTQQGKKGTNQDAMIVWENFCTRSNTNAIFCGVFDGHGPFGHMVARKVRDALPVLLCQEWEAKSVREQIPAGENGINAGMIRFDEFMDDDRFVSIEVDDCKIPEMHMPLKRSILKAFKLMDKELKLHPTIDCFCSGTTAVTLIMQDQDLILGNIGDSRAVLATRDNDNSLKAVQLTIDLKPNLPREAARIQKCMGRVFALQDEPEVPRVWLPNSDSPGLAMARAFGDFCLKDFGLISIPDVYHHRITKGDEFVILATDGVWDVLSNKEAVDIVASAPGHAIAARALVDCATRSWRLKYPTSKNDDCAVVCLFLHEVAGVTLAKAQTDITSDPNVEKNVSKEEANNSLNIDDVDSRTDLVHSGTIKESSEIVSVVEHVEEKLPKKILDPSKRSLAECLSTTEEEEWSALKGVTRVNSLLSLPRFLSFEKRSASWRKWL